MRVAILTFSRTNNYGATLQCYALNCYIRSLGYDTITINLPLDDGSVRKRKESIVSSHAKPTIAERVVIKIKAKLLKIHAKCIKREKVKPLLYEPYEIRYSLTKEKREEEMKYSTLNMELFDAFRAKYLPNLTKEYFEENDFKKDYPDADVYIVGSDQVWNTSITRWQYRLFFLSFVRKGKKKVSYAACMGGTENIKMSKRQIHEIRRMLKSFDNISVRNSIAANILRDKFSLNVEQVLDPTFLLDNYDLIEKDSTLDASGALWFDKYIINDLWLNAINYVAEQKKLIIRADTNLIQITGIPFNPVVTIADWLKLVKTSDFIFTDSFHCTVFCILYRKQFISTPSYKGGEGRMIDLLNKLGLEDRFYNNPSSVIDNAKKWQAPIKYDKVFEKINVLRIESKEYLKKSLLS